MRAQRSPLFRSGSERGVALITTIMIMMLMSALMIGFSAVVMSDQRYRLIDRDRVRAFYGAQSGIEKLNADLANLFFVNVAPSAGEIAALSEEPPAIPEVTFTTEGNGAYGVTHVPLAQGETGYGHVTTGPYQGLLALKRRYDLDATVHTVGGGEAHLRRSVETVAIPVFQFGVFSSVDLSFHAGPNFNFGGRVHTNGNLFLAQGSGGTLTLPERITAVGEVVRERLANASLLSATGHTGTVRIATAPGAYRNLDAVNEGSVVDSLGSAKNEPRWTNLSLSAYNGYIRNGRTGARQLNLPLLTSGGENTDLIRRPGSIDEDDTNSTLFGERMFGKVSLRILLSDTANDISSIPTVTVAAPVSLDTAAGQASGWNVAPPAGYVVSATRPPIARTQANEVFRLTNAAVNAGNAAAGTARNMPIASAAGVPPSFRIPLLSATNTTGAVVTITCTGRTLLSFTGCTGTVPAPAVVGTVATGAQISGVVATADGNVMVTATLNGNWRPAGPPVDNIIETVGETSQFAPNSFWHEGTNTLITCTGYDMAPATDLFTGCNVPVTIPATATTIMTTSARANEGIGTIGGFLKIEMQDTDHAWRDVTLEFLNYGFAGPSLSAHATATVEMGRACPDPTPNAIIRLQRLRDNYEPGAGNCSYAASQRSTDYWPNVLFDQREALYRDVPPAGSTPLVGGVMHYVTLDVLNLKRWLEGTHAYGTGSGRQALSTNGYSVYFSDRRNNRNAGNQETGEFGFEDVINPTSSTGAPSGSLDTGEDVNANKVLDAYGRFPSYNGTYSAVPPCGGTCVAVAPYTVAPITNVAVGAGVAKTNRALLFRRALKLVNGGRGNIVTPGLTIVAENPVYVQGDWNMDATALTNPHAATSIIADAVTVLSNSWNDVNSFSNPWTTAGRVRPAQSYYRFAVIAGKNAPFPGAPVQGNPAEDFGTDGGVHNFLRMLEEGGTVNYRGSIATFYFSRQAVGTYKVGPAVYGAPTRIFNFDTDFLNPAKLPPLTPVFRDVNSLGFEQETRPGR